MHTGALVRLAGEWWPRGWRYAESAGRGRRLDLHLYTLLILAVPLALIALSRGHWPLVLMASLALWGVHQFAPGVLPGAAKGTAFSAFAWQVLFYVPLVVGYHRSTIWGYLSRIPLLPAVVVLGTLGVALSAQQISSGTLLPPGTWTRDLYDYAFWKWDVRLGRLVASLVLFPLAYLLVTALWRPVLSLLGWAMLPLGQRALAAYSLHLVVVLLAARKWLSPPGVELAAPTVAAWAQLVGVGLVLAALGARPWLELVLGRMKRLELSRGWWSRGV
jgi:OpgC protein